jgi:hypothetical protein
MNRVEMLAMTCSMAARRRNARARICNWMARKVNDPTNNTEVPYST